MLRHCSSPFLDGCSWWCGIEIDVGRNEIRDWIIPCGSKTIRKIWQRVLTNFNNADSKCVISSQKKKGTSGHFFVCTLSICTFSLSRKIEWINTKFAIKQKPSALIGYVESISNATGNDWKDTLEHAFNKIAWGPFMGQREYWQI